MKIYSSTFSIGRESHLFFPIDTQLLFSHTAPLFISWIPHTHTHTHTHMVDAVVVVIYRGPPHPMSRPDFFHAGVRLQLSSGSIEGHSCFPRRRQSIFSMHRTRHSGVNRTSSNTTSSSTFFTTTIGARVLLVRGGAIGGGGGLVTAAADAARRRGRGSRFQQGW